MVCSFKAQFICLFFVRDLPYYRHLQQTNFQKCKDVSITVYWSCCPNQRFGLNLSADYNRQYQQYFPYVVNVVNRVDLEYMSIWTITEQTNSIILFIDLQITSISHSHYSLIIHYV